MIELDLELIIEKPFVLRRRSMQIMHKISLNLNPLGPFLLCFYFIAHPKGPIEHDRIVFGASNFETFCSQIPRYANNSLNFTELKSLGTVPFVFLLDCVSQGTCRT